MICGGVRVIIRTGINSGSEDVNNIREPVTLSLFPEYFEDEDET